MKIFEFDGGNTRMKWRVIRQGEIVCSGVLENDGVWQPELAALLEELKPLGCIRGSLVSGAARRACIEKAAEDVLALQVDFAATQKSWQGLEVVYPQPEKLGVDRWLAMLAARHRYPERNLVVVDCGTAITVDIVSASGKHLGGYLVPGIRLMKQVLLQGTADIKVAIDDLKNVSPGKNTEACIGHGMLAMVKGMVDQAIQAAGDNPLVILSGGDGRLLSDHLQYEWIEEPSLVMDGLTFAFASAS
ncbi:type III pantothenate kinase [Spongorhabdus nitratireducens]